MNRVSIESQFSEIAKASAHFMGTWQAFTAACALIIAWLVAGIFVGFENQLYQLVINTLTTIITFLMVFLLQHSQNRDSKAVQMKLDELIRATQEARNALIAVEDTTEDEMAKVRAEVIKSSQCDVAAQ